ncbi:hypothetical protein Hanom_Chr04g00311041 [Helianthus anomalus]
MFPNKYPTDRVLTNLFFDWVTYGKLSHASPGLTCVYGSLQKKKKKKKKTHKKNASVV